MSTTRREFLSVGATGLSFVALGQAMPRLFAAAAEESARAANSDRALVVLELSGGNDGLNTLVPFADDLYYKNRPTLGIPQDQVQKLSERVGLHPSLTPLAELYRDGQVSIVQGAGYPEPDRSHFRSMEIWHTASTDKRPPTTGWIGRFADSLPAAGEEDSLVGLALGGALPQACLADKVVIPVVGRLESFASQATPAEISTRRKLAASDRKASSPADFIRRQTATVIQTADRLQAATAKYRSSVEYPGSDLGQQLRRAAQILSGNLGTRVLFVSQGGYDTHAYQGDQHAQLLGDLAGSLAAFQRDLAAQGLAEKVAVLVFSEFGRRVDENASAGTDHGAASCVFVLGQAIKGGLVGEHPPLDKLGDGDLIYTTDFRGVYATLLDDWLGCPHQRVLGREFPRLPLV